jgi:hypothetical protein
MRKLVALALALALAAPAALAAEETPYINFIKRVQIRLHELGFDPGPINGDYSGQTQAALAQFQLSRLLPVSGNLDEATVLVLDVPREEGQSDSAAVGR